MEVYFKICKIYIQNKNYTTIGEDVVCIPQRLDRDDLEPCTRQEADRKFMLLPFDLQGDGGRGAEIFLEKVISVELH